MKIKRKTYYKYHTFNDQDFDIIYTGNRWIYIVAEKYGTRPLEKHDYILATSCKQKYV